MRAPAPTSAAVNPAAAIPPPATPTDTSADANAAAAGTAAPIAIVAVPAIADSFATDDTADSTPLDMPPRPEAISDTPRIAALLPVPPRVLT